MKRQNINICVVGLGMGQVHAEMIQKTPGLTLAGICDMNPKALERAAKKFPVRQFTDYKEVLRDRNIDLVTLATPHSAHKPMAVAAMNAGKHVVVEKIMCLNTREADEMLRARDKNKVTLSVFHNRRWDKDFLTVKKIVEDGLIGDAFLIESRMHFYGEWRGWRGQRKFGGGLINDWGAHMVDQLLLLNPGVKVKEVYGAFKYRVFKSDVEKHVHARLSFANGHEGVVEVSMISDAKLPRWYILGEKGSLVIDPLKWDKQNWWNDSAWKAEVFTRPGGQEVYSQIGMVRSDWQPFYQNIAEHILQGKKLAVRPEDVRRAVHIIESIHKSAGSGRVIKVEK